MSEHPLSTKRHATFESIRQVDESGNEFGSARQLAKAFEYSEYRHFLSVVAKARENGARFRRGSSVSAIERDGTGWRVTTSRGEIRARRIVNTAGPWAAQIAKMVGASREMVSRVMKGLESEGYIMPAEGGRILLRDKLSLYL